jgi:hypothetical protein
LYLFIQHFGGEFRAGILDDVQARTLALKLRQFLGPSGRRISRRVVTVTPSINVLPLNGTTRRTSTCSSGSRPATMSPGFSSSACIGFYLARRNRPPTSVTTRPLPLF